MTPATLTLPTPTVRALPPEEWHRLAGHAPFDSSGLPDPTHWRIIVAEVGDLIVGFVCLFEAVHLEPLWVDPAYRARPHLFGQLLTELWGASKAVLDEAGVSIVFAQVDDATVARAGGFLEHLGFQPSPGALYFVPLAAMRLGGS